MATKAASVNPKSRAAMSLWELRILVLDVVRNKPTYRTQTVMRPATVIGLLRDLNSRLHQFRLIIIFLFQPFFQVTAGNLSTAQTEG